MPRLLEKDINTPEVLSWEGVHLLHFAGSACSQKTRIFLNLKGIDWVSHSVNLATQQNFTPWFLGINPRGLVPVLVHNGAVHIESDDILRYLEKTFSEPSLLGNLGQEEIDALLREEDDLHLDLRTLTMRFVLPSFLAQKKPASLASYEQDAGTIGGKPDAHKQVELGFWRAFAEQGITDAQVGEATSRFFAVYQELEGRLREQPYLAGSEISVIDIAWFIYTHRLTQAGYPFARLHPVIVRWYEGLLARKEFAREVRAPVPLVVVSGLLNAVQALRGTRLADVAKFPYTG